MSLGAVPASSQAWLLRPPSAREGLTRLLCLPFAGSGAAWYLAWTAAVGSQVDVIPLQLPGRENRLAEPALSDMVQLVEALSAAALPLCRPPFAIFGHSMGALLAYEFVRALQAAGRPLPVCLFVSGAPAPDLPPMCPLLSGLTDDALIQAMEERFGNRIEPEMLELVRLALPTLRADVRAVETRRLTPAEPLPVPLFALAGESDAAVPLAEVRQWERHAGAGFELKVFQGQHLFVTAQRDAVAGYVGRVLARQVRGVAP